MLISCMRVFNILEMVGFFVLNKISIFSIFLTAISLGIWVYGSSIEQGDMSNAGFQVFGALGTVFFTLIFISTMIIKLITNIRKKKLN